MSYLPDSFVNSPTSAVDDPAWQLHSSTDSYLNWDANPKSPLNHPQDATLTTAAATATAPTMSRLRSSSSTATPSVASSRTPNEPGSADAASVVSHHGHSNTTPERPQSPSYFTRLYFQPPNRSSSGTSPTITFTGAPTDPSVVAASPLPTLSAEVTQSAAHLSDPARQQAPARRSSVGAASNSPTSSTPLSPTMSSKSTTSGGGFFASLRPSSPGNLTAATSRIPEGEPYVKPRRPSSVFEHVGNVWERFGRKVHHTRSSTSEQQSSSSSHGRRTASQASPPIGLAPEAVDPFDNAHHSPSASIASQASPSHSTATESEFRTPATPGGEPPASLSTPQPLPSAPAYSQLSSADTAADPRLQDEVEELPYLAPEPAPTFAQSSAAQESPRIATAHRSQASHRRESSLFERVLIQVTDDNERFAVVDISGVDSADAIKERMFAKLHLFDADHSSFQLFRTEIGQSEATGPVVNDDALLVLCLQMGDDRGTLKFLVQQTAPPNATVRAMPPPTSTAGQQRALNEVRRISGAGSATSNHLRTESQSSRSSISDALIYPEMVGADGGHEGSNRNSGSSLTRSKAQARRALPSAPPIDDLRSPTHGYHDRRSIASSGEGHAQEASSKHASSVSEGSGAPVMLSQRSSSMNATQPAATSSSNSGRRPSHVEDERPRFDSESSANRSLQAPQNGLGHRQERSDEGVRDQSRQQAPGLTLHNAKSMDDLHRPAQASTQAPALIPQAEVRMQAGLDRDGRYPAPSIMRPSTAAPAGPGARDAGHGHRQYSSDALGANKAPVDPASLDPRMLQRNRSAQAAIPSSQQLANHGPTRMSSTPQIRSPPMQPSYPARGPVDPRYARPAGMEDPRFAQMPAHPAQSLQPRPTSPAARPPQFNAPSTYGGPNSYSVQSFGPSQRPMAPGYVNEFGARAPNAPPSFNTYHGHDPRLGGNGMQGSLTPRPYSYHEASSTHHPAYRPYSPQLAPSPYRTREDPFTTRYFPASSSRQVSEFQMQAGRLEPGMTVQQTLRTQEAIRNTVSGPPTQSYHAHAHPPGPSYGPRDPRQPGQPNQYMGMQPYPNTSAPPSMPPMPQRSSHPTSAHPNPHHPPSSRPQQFAQQGPPQHGPPQHSHPPARNAHDMPNPNAAYVGAQPRPHSSASSGGRGVAPQASAASLASAPGPESHRRDPPVRVNPSERSSGSSFSSQTSSGPGRPSQEDRNSRNSTEDSFSAPTSARSSQSGPASAKPANGENRSSYAEQERELADDELARLRPLPKLPASSAGTPTDTSSLMPSSTKGAGVEAVRKSEDEDTLRAGEWAKLWRALEPASDGTVVGTAVSGSSGGDGDTVRAEPSTPGPSRPQTKDGLGSASAPLEPPRVPSPSMAPEENGTVASFGVFDDDESESGTWAQPLDSDVNAPRLPLRLDGDEDATSDDHSTLLPGQGTLLQSPARVGGTATSSSPKRPELRLTIDPAAGPTLLAPASQPAGLSPVPSSSHLSSSLSSGGITRSNSFARRDDDWAFRPPPEQLYENLDDFFPKHDLDKPLLDTTAVPESPMVSSPRSEAAVGGIASSPPNAPQQAQSQRSRLKRSIRLVAQDRKRFLDRAGKRATEKDAEASSGLVRRRSTKLWGTRVVEMTPGQELATPASATSAESPLSDTSPPKPVFKWVKGDLIGKGTYGRVYLALNATTGEMIAVKQVELPRTASDREDSRQKGVVAALKSEIETLKDLDHPHIVSYLGFEETTTFLSIFLEYVPGGSVGSCLRKHGKFEEPTIKSFLHQILDGLAYLHSKGILHRDLKADNILVDFEGICKISDFGTVRRSDDIYGNVENMSLQGSIFWMAPEVVSLSKKGYSAKIDIWSLGCVVLEMFAGRRPWSDDEAVQAMFKIGAERKAPPIPADVKLSKQAAHFLKNCFEVDPAKRPTAQRLLDHVFSVPDESWHFQQSALWRSLQR